MVTTQVVLQLLQSHLGVEIATEVVGFAVAEVVKPDLVDVGTNGGLCDVNCALFNGLTKVFLSAFAQSFTGGASAMVKRPDYFYGSGKGVGIFWWGLHVHATLTISHLWAAQLTKNPYRWEGGLSYEPNVWR
jgi:hypothetical protein